MQYVGICDICGYFSVPFPIDQKCFGLLFFSNSLLYQEASDIFFMTKMKDVFCCINTMDFEAFRNLSN